MKNTGEILDSVVALLRKASPVAVMIDGEWGCGKTYFWEKSVRPRLSDERVLYCSLFGASSIDEIKKKILVSSLAAAMEDNQPQLSTSQKDERFLRGLSVFGRAILSKVEKAVGIEVFSSAIDPISLISDGAVICFDDAERIAPGLDVSQVFGLMDYLREIKKYKIVILVNGEHVKSGLGKGAEFSRYSEKIVNRYYKVEADVPAFLASRERPLSDAQKGVIGMALVRMEQINLRTLDRVMSFVEDFCGLYPHRVIQHHHLAMIAGFMCDRDAGKLRPRSFYERSNHWAYMNQKKEPDAAAAWDDFLDTYLGPWKEKYVFSLTLYEFVRTGQCDYALLESELFPVVQQMGERERALHELGESFFLGDIRRKELLSYVCEELEKPSDNVGDLIKFSEFIYQSWDVFDVDTEERDRLEPQIASAFIVAGRREKKRRDFGYWHMQARYVSKIEKHQIAYNAAFKSADEERKKDQLKRVLLSEDQGEFYSMKENDEQWCVRCIGDEAVRGLIGEMGSVDFQYYVMLDISKHLSELRVVDGGALLVWAQLASVIAKRSKGDRYRMLFLCSMMNDAEALEVVVAGESSV